MKTPIAITFVSAIIRQLISSPDLKEKVASVFLYSLLGTTLGKGPLTSQDLSHFKREDSVEVTVKKILRASSDGYWGALRAVMSIYANQGLSLIIDGLDNAKHENHKFIQEVRAFIEILRERPTTTRVLLTSQPQAAIKDILSGLPYIEYDKERKECLNSLRLDNTSYENIAEEYEGSLEWLWMHEEYRAWSSTDSSDLLLIEGKPGSGKSTLKKYFKRCLEQSREKQIVASFHYRCQEGKQQTNHCTMLQSLLHDILNQNEEFFFHFQPYYRQIAKHCGQLQWTYNSLKEVLLSLAKNHSVKERLYLIIDAVDESDDGQRYDIIEFLHELCATKGSCNVKVFVASRPVFGLSGQSTKANKMIRLQDVNYSDILLFASGFLGKLGLLPWGGAGPAWKCLQYIAQSAQGVFVWVRLVIKYAKRGFTKNEIFGFLKSLPTELEGLYKHILVQLERGETRDVETGKVMLQLVFYAFRPLRPEELRQALAMRASVDTTLSCSDESFEGELIHGIEERIISCAGSLLGINGSDENSTVQVTHQTVLEFFRPGGPTAQTKFHIDSENGHRRMAATCIRYLMLCCSNTSLADQRPHIRLWTSEHFEAHVDYLHQRPFITYALSYLETHIQRCGEDSRVSGLLSQFREHLTNLQNPAYYIFGNWVTRNRCLEVAAYKHNSTSAKNVRRMLLHAATKKRYSRVVEALLVVGAEVEACRDGKTALIVAAESGDIATVQVLLGQNASIEATDRFNRTALHLAALNGRNAVVRQLIDRGANLEAEDKEKQRGLHLAAGNGHTAVIELLINRGADKEAEDGERRRGLHYAAKNGQTDSVELLIYYGADKNAQDKYGQTGLHLAAGNGHTAVIKLLINRGADKEAEDFVGRRGLHLAEKNGHTAVVELLINGGTDK